MAMHSYARLVESVRRTRNTLYLVSGLYIAVGFVVAVATVVQHDRLGTFLGFIIISGALSMGLIARTALQVLVRVGHMEKSLHGFAERIDQVIPLILANQHSATATVQDAESLVDLTKIGAGAPHLLAAATLNHEVFPRLVVAIEPPAGETRAGNGSSSAVAPMAGDTNAPGGATTKDLLRQWNEALCREDLLECRRVYSALIDVVEENALIPLAEQIRKLEDRWERTLREQFSRLVQSRKFAAAMAMGDQIVALLPDRRIAADFGRIRPILIRRADEALAACPAPS